MSFMKKVGIAKQWVKQKTGNAEASQDPPEFVETIKRFRETRHHFERLQKASESVFKTNMASVAAIREFSVVLASTAENVGGQAAPEYLHIAKVSNDIADNLDLFNKEHNTCFVVPLTGLVAQDISSANSLKHSIQNAKLNFDAVNSGYESAKAKGSLKQAELEIEKNQSMDELDSLRRQLGEMLEQIESKRDSEIAAACQGYLEAWGKYHRHSAGDTDQRRAQ